MATIEKRLQELESKVAVDEGGVNAIILVGFVGTDDKDSDIKHIYHGDDHFYKEPNETEAEFKNRAATAIRERNQIDHKCVLLLFGDRKLKSELIDE